MFRVLKCCAVSASAIFMVSYPLQAQENEIRPAPDRTQPGGPQGERQDERGRGIRGRGGIDAEFRPNVQLQALRRRFDRMLGEDAPATLESLPYGLEHRLVNQVPVGGIDTLDDRQKGWKVEEIYTLTEEQQTSLNNLRDAYANELSKLQEQLNELHHSMAKQVVALRKNYETKALDVLGAEQRSEKEALDALAVDFVHKTKEKSGTVKPEVDKLFEESTAMLTNRTGAAAQGNGLQQMIDLMNRGRELMTKIESQNKELYEEYKAQYLQKSTGPARESLETAFRKIDARNERQREMWGRMQRGPGQDRPAQQPPRAPNIEF